MKLFDKIAPASIAFLAFGLVLFFYSESFREKFTDPDYHSEKRLHDNKMPSISIVLHILIFMFVVVLFVLVAILGGTAAGLSEKDSIFVGVFTSNIALSLYGVYQLQRRARNLKYYLPSLDRPKNLDYRSNIGKKPSLDVKSALVDTLKTRIRRHVRPRLLPTASSSAQGEENA